MWQRKLPLQQLALVSCMLSIQLMISVLPLKQWLGFKGNSFDGAVASVKTVDNVRGKKYQTTRKDGTLVEYRNLTEYRFFTDGDFSQFSSFQNETHVTCFIRTKLSDRDKGWSYEVMHISKFVKKRKCRFFLGRDTIFFHQGKSGGGTFTALEAKYRLGLHIDHPAPRKTSIRDLTSGPLTSLIMSIRDPIEHFVSMFNWQLLILCHPDDKRIADGHAHPGSPDRFCMNTRPQQERTLRETYGGDPNLLAEASCEDSGRYEQAIHDLSEINHSMMISEWLQFLIDPHMVHSIKAQGVQNFMVIPMSSNFEDDIEALMSDLLKKRYEGNILEALDKASSREMESVERKKELKKHSSVPSSAKKHSSLSKRAECCLARYYEKDYQVIQTMLGGEPAVLEPIEGAHPVLGKACDWGNFEQQELCRSNLRSMLKSRNDYFLGDGKATCAKLDR